MRSYSEPVDGNAYRGATTTGGHYESYFVRGNHPTRPLAVWVRYTSFRAGDGSVDQGEVWATWFDGERDLVVTAYRAYDAGTCTFGGDPLDVRIGEARLTEGSLTGAVDRLAWELTYTPSPPILLFPEGFYDKPFPKAKQLTVSPASRLSGSVTVDGEAVSLTDWPGAQSHNWGSQHTDLYAWGQVCGFDGDPDAYLECGSARLRIGVPLPMLSPVVLRLDGRDHLLNGPVHWLRNRATFGDWRWELRARGDDLRLRVRFAAPPERFARLSYRNPPGGEKTCLNSKLATCEVVVEQSGRAARTLRSANRAAFEVLGDAADLVARGFSSGPVS